MLARLQAESSTNMYSEHGLLALIRPEFGQVCQRLIVRVVLHAGIAAAPGGVGHLGEHLPRGIRWPGHFRLGDPVRRPGLIGFDRPHELVADADREIGVLEQHGVVGLLRIVALLDQRADLLLLAILALDELQHVGMPVLDRLHLGGPAGLAAAFHHGRNLIVDPHKRQRPGGAAAAGELLAVRAQRREIGARARAELEEHRLAAGKLHDVFHVVAHALDEARRRLRKLVRILRLNRLAAGLVPVPIAHRPLDAVLMIQADVEPDGRIE